MRLRTIIFALLLCTAVSAAAQPYYFRHYQVEEGLSYNSVLCSMQDKQGFMWFGTRDGLNRFDGYLFKTYKRNPADPLSLGNNYVYNLAQDDQGKIWVGTRSGLYQFNPLTGRFTLQAGTAGKIIDGIAIDRNRRTWFLASGKLFCINREHQLQSFEISNAQRLTAIALGKANDLWLATELGYVINFTPQNGAYRYYDVFSKTPHITARRVEKIWRGDGGQLYIGTSNHGIKLLDIGANTYKDILTFDDNHTEILARAFCRADADNIWIGTESGVYIYNTVTGAVRNLKRSYYDPYSLSDNAVYTIYRDKEGGMWVGTYFGGINYFSVTGAQFEKFIPKETPGAMRGSLIREFCQDANGYLWIGTEDAGLNRFDPATNTFLNVGFTGKPGSIAYNNVHGLLSVGNELWIGTYQHGLDVLDINTHKVIRHYGNGDGPNDLKTNFVNVLFKSRYGQIYLGTQLGLYRYNKTNNNFTHVVELGVAYIASISEDHTGKLWVGTFGNSVYVLNPGQNLWNHMESQPGKPGALTSNVVTDVFEDSRNRIWLATENGGLCEYNAQKATFSKYKLPAGLSNKYLFKIIEDDHKRLWITSSGGLICIEPTKGYLRVFTKADGILNDQFNYRSAFKDSRGRLYFGSSKGFLRHNSYTPVNTSRQVPLYITGLQVEGKNKQKRYGNDNVPLPYAGHVTLGPGSTTFSIDVAALNYAAPGTTFYSYKLEGLDKGWTTILANRRIYYTQVPPGNYVFKVKAKTGDNSFTTQPRELQIEIIPPFYAGTPALVIYTLLLSLIIYLVFKQLHKRNEELNSRKMAFLETQKEREIYQAKIDFFTHITHEIRTPLSLIKAPLEKVLQANNLHTITPDLQLMERNTDRLLDLVDQLLTFRRTEIDGYRLNFNRTNISAILGNLCTLFNESAQQAGINLEVKTANEQLTAYVDMEAFNKIISNLLSNAIKYADSTIIVRLENENEHEFSLIVKNDGAVLPPDIAKRIFEPFVRSDVHSHKPGTGIGLPLAKALVDLHQGVLKYLVEDDNLNTFKLTVPFHQPVELNIGLESNEFLPDALPENQPDNGKPVILLVEDQKDFREFVYGLLNDNYRVFAVTDADKAKEVLAIQNVQLIVSDVMMPGIDGFEFCRQLKSDINFSHIPFILLTAKNTFASKIEGLDCGSDAFIEKPFSPKHLKMQIVNLLKNRDHIKAYFAHSPSVHLKTVATSKADSDFLNKLDTLIRQNLSRPDFDIAELADQMNLSRPTLYRKVKAITGLSPTELVGITRLKQAADMLLSGEYKIYEIAEEVGFASSAVLSRAFQKQFGMPPSAYIIKNTQQ